MTQDDIEMIEKIMDSGKMGYAYLFPSDGGETKGYLVSIQPQNIAEFVNCYSQEGMRIIITDMAERPVIEVHGAKIEVCTDFKFGNIVTDKLNSGRNHGEQNTSLLAVPKETADQYFFAEDQAVTAIEAGML